MGVEHGRLLDQVQSLYDQNRFLDAHALVHDAWRGRAWVEQATVEELVLAARLSGRLGGRAQMRWLYRQADRRFPNHVLVRMYGRWMPRRSWTLLRELSALEAQPSLGSGDPASDAMYDLDSAHFWAVARDFARAHELIDRSRGLLGDIRWLHCTEGHVLMMEERWAEAAESAMKAWALSPGMPAAADLVARSLLRLGRGDEAGEILSSCAAGQSLETLVLLLWLTACRAERGDAERRRLLTEQAWAWANRLDELAPLADRSARYQIAACRFDLAMLRGDHEQMQANAARVPIPLYREIALQLRHGGGQRTVMVDYRPVFQKGPQCLPTSIASIAACFGRTIDAEQLARSLTYSGTPVWRALKWLRENGYAAGLFVLSGPTCRSLLGAGIPFVYLIEHSLEAGHATAAVGLDEGAGIMIYHDPDSERFGRILVDRIADLEGPLGPFGLVFVPAERAHVLETIPPQAREVGEFCCRYWESLYRSGPREAGSLLEQAEALHADWPAVRTLRASWQTMAGDVLAGVAQLEALAAEFPKSVVLHRLLLDGLNRTRNFPRIRQAMSDIVHQGRLPGISQEQPWRYPPERCVCQYADMISQTQEGCREALRHLETLVRRRPHPLAFHTLGEIHLRHFRPASAVLPARLASLMDEHDENFARTAYNACHIAGRTSQGLDHLRRRVDKLGRLVDGSGPWMTLILVLEEIGQAEQALQVAQDALAARAGDAVMGSFLVQFWIRMGQWEQARQVLEECRTGRRADYLWAAVAFHRDAGQWEQALELAEQLVAESPNWCEAYTNLAWLRANRQSLESVAELAGRWKQQHPGDEAFEFLHYDLLRTCAREDECGAYIRRRLERNDQDAWAWRELAHLLLDRAELLEPQERGEVMRELTRAAEQAVRLSPHDPATLGVRGRIAVMNGQSDAAAQDLLEALRLSPSAEGSYLTVWSCAAGRPLDQQRAVLDQLRERMALIQGPLHPARKLAVAVAQRLGLEQAEQFLQSLADARGEDPELIEARADLLLTCGQGRTDAARAAELIEQALPRYPQHFDLRMSLADAYGTLLREDQRREILQDALRRRPLASRARVDLAEVLLREGKHDQAADLLRQGVRANPRDAMCWHALASTISRSGDKPQAVQIIREALAVLPENVFLRENLVYRLGELGQIDQALEAVQAGLKIYPDSCVFYYLQAEALLSAGSGVDVQAVEKALRTSLSLNCRYWDAADRLAWLLANQQRCDEAEAVVRKIQPHLGDDSVARGRLAWIRWQRGQRTQAVADLAQTLEVHPGYRMGWWWLTEWLEETKDSEQARRLLEAVPPAIRTDPDLAVRRMHLLRGAVLSAEQAEALWEQVLGDFPTNTDLYCLRFDELIDLNELDKAQEILDRAERHCPPSEYLAARRVGLLGYQGKNR